MNRVLARFRRAQLDAEAAAQVAEVLLESGAELPRPEAGPRAPGDKRKLRGIPVVGVQGGAGGAIGGSRPGVDRELDQWPRPDPD